MLVGRGAPVTVGALGHHAGELARTVWAAARLLWGPRNGITRRDDRVADSGRGVDLREQLGELGRELGGVEPGIGEVRRFFGEPKFEESGAGEPFVGRRRRLHVGGGGGSSRRTPSVEQANRNGRSRPRQFCRQIIELPKGFHQVARGAVRAHPGEPGRTSPSSPVSPTPARGSARGLSCRPTVAVLGPVGSATSPVDLLDGAFEARSVRGGHGLAPRRNSSSSARGIATRLVPSRSCIEKPSTSSSESIEGSPRAAAIDPRARNSTHRGVTRPSEMGVRRERKRPGHDETRHPEEQQGKALVELAAERGNDRVR